MNVKQQVDKPSRDDAARIAEALAAEFHPDDVKYKPQVVHGQRALALPYVDARVIQDRLDEVLGVAGWQDEYQVLADGSVMCHLRLLIGGSWVTKTDVGGPSEQPDSADRMKAAFSDALKRAAVKFGIGRYLYRIPQRWLDYDPVRKRFLNTERGPETRREGPANRENFSPSEMPRRNRLGNTGNGGHPERTEAVRTTG